MKNSLFDRDQLALLPLRERESLLDLSNISELTAVPRNDIPSPLLEISKRIITAKNQERAVILMIGAHVIRSGVQRYLVDLMKRGYIRCLAMNGAGVIHDFENALIGATTESVARYIKSGQFGLWHETGQINDIINAAYHDDDQAGLGESMGRYILEQELPNKDVSLLANACKYDVLPSIHVGIGYDIIHEHPNFNGAATGALSYNDFLKFARTVQELEDGVIMNFGSAIMAPEVYLKALSMARNVAGQEGNEIRHFSTLVCDLHDLPETYRTEASKECAAYYFRPWKTMLVRTVADGGESFYVNGRHARTIPALWTAIGIFENEDCIN
jgi:hypothetical protein